MALNYCRCAVLLPLSSGQHRRLRRRQALVSNCQLLTKQILEVRQPQAKQRTSFLVCVPERLCRYLLPWTRLPSRPLVGIPV